MMHKSLALPVLALALSACTSAAVPARLLSPTSACLRQIEAVAQQASGHGVTLGNTAFADSDTLLLEPAAALKLDGRVLGLPTAFRLSQQGRQCLLTHSASGRQTVLERCDCVPLQTQPSP